MEGEALSNTVGVSLSALEGDSLGNRLGLSLCRTVGDPLLTMEGVPEGNDEGNALKVGASLGAIEGKKDPLGFKLGSPEGLEVDGDPLGAAEGS